jgi:hypothetical protein
MDVQFLLGERVRYRGRVGTVVQHAAASDIFVRTVVISFPAQHGRVAEDVTVPAYLWPLITVEDTED